VNGLERIIVDSGSSDGVGRKGRVLIGIDELPLLHQSSFLRTVKVQRLKKLEAKLAMQFRVAGYPTDFGGLNGKGFVRQGSALLSKCSTFGSWRCPRSDATQGTKDGKLLSVPCLIVFQSEKSAIRRVPWQSRAVQMRGDGESRSR
jgi:hypothetical protein